MLEPLEIRAARGELTQAVFARRLGVSLATVRNWETGRTRPAGGNLLRLEAWIRGDHHDAVPDRPAKDLSNEALLDEVRFRMVRQGA